MMPLPDFRADVRCINKSFNYVLHGRVVIVWTQIEMELFTDALSQYSIGSCTCTAIAIT
jgi:hypothetical protein